MKATTADPLDTFKPTTRKTALIACRLLKRIYRLRLQHTANFVAHRWQPNDAISNKLAEAWAQYHALPDWGKQDAEVKKLIAQV